MTQSFSSASEAIGGIQSSTEPMLTWGRTHFNAWYENLPKYQRVSLSKYQGVGWYELINRVARDDLRGISESDENLALDYLIDIRATITLPVPDDLIVFRGSKNWPTEISPGKVIVNRSLTSTSLDASVALRFARWEGLADGILFEIQIPRDTPAAWLELVTSCNEYELLFDTDLTLEVVSVEYPRSDGRRLVRCEVRQ